MGYLTFFTSCIYTAGEGGNVLVNENAARVGIYNVWDYSDGQDAYTSSMLVDLTRPPQEVANQWRIHKFVLGGKAGV